MSMRGDFVELVTILKTVTALEVVPQGSEVGDNDLFVSYLSIPGGVERAFDGGGPYLAVWQIDVWCRKHTLAPDPEEMTFSVSQQIVEHMKGLPRYSIRQMPMFTSPSEASMGYARALLKLNGIYSL